MGIRWWGKIEAHWCAQKYTSLRDNQKLGVGAYTKLCIVTEWRSLRVAGVTEDGRDCVQNSDQFSSIQGGSWMRLSRAGRKSLSLSHTVGPLSFLGDLRPGGFLLGQGWLVRSWLGLPHLASFKGNQKSRLLSDTLCLWDPKAGLRASFDPARWCWPARPGAEPL